MDGLRNHGPLGLDMLKAPPSLREKKNCACACKTRTHTQCVGFYGRIKYFGYCIGKVKMSKLPTFGEVCTAPLLFLTLHVTGQQPSDSFPNWNWLRPTWGAAWGRRGWMGWLSCPLKNQIMHHHFYVWKASFGRCSLLCLLVGLDFQILRLN